MFKRIIDGLFYPSEIIHYRNDKKIITIGVLLFFAILLMVPSLISLFLTKPFDYDAKVAIRNSFSNNIEIPYIIENNKLTFVGDTEKTQYYVNVEEMNLTVIFSTQEQVILEKNMLGSIIVFTTDHVYLYNQIKNQRLLNYYEYPSFDSIDFRLAKNNNYQFWNQMFSIVQKVLDNNETLILSLSLVIIVFQAILMIVITTLLLTLFNRLGSNNIYSFAMHWKMMIYFSGPFVLGFLLATLFNTMIFEYVGLIVTLIYSFKINQINFTKGE